MSRAAFAVMIKFCDLTDEFSNLIKAVEIESEMLEDMDNAKKEEAVIEFMMNQKQADKIIKIYESSSRMRSWLDEKKISLEEDFQAQLKKDIPKGQEEAEKVEGD